MAHSDERDTQTLSISWSLDTGPFPKEPPEWGSGPWEQRADSGVSGPVTGAECLLIAADNGTIPWLMGRITIIRLSCVSLVYCSW